jgi:riboflavin synthase
MFTGIVQETGKVKSIRPIENARRLEVVFKKKEGLSIGDSVAVSGVCLTAVGLTPDGAAFDIMEETYRVSSFSAMRTGDTVNIERSLAAGGRIEGHFVLGHVDRVSAIRDIGKEKDPYFEIAIPEEDRVFIVKKGSIALDGISLTIAEIGHSGFRVYIIPHTVNNTNLKYKKKGDPVNIEYDCLGKYAVQKMMNAGAGKSLTMEFLRKHGF